MLQRGPPSARLVLLAAASVVVVVTVCACPTADYREVQQIHGPKYADTKREANRQNQRVFLTPIIEQDGSIMNNSHGYLGLNNQREVLQNLLLAAERLRVNVFLPPVALGTNFDPRPADLIRTGSCNSTSDSHDGSFDPPFNATRLSSDSGFLFGPASVVWDTRRYASFAHKFFGALSVVESKVIPEMDCVNYDAGFRHVVLDTPSDSDLGKHQVDSSAQDFLNRIESWRQAILEDDASEPTVYHVFLGFALFPGALNRNKCHSAFGDILCQAALEATAFSNHIKSRARQIVNAMHSASAEGGFDVAHYHDWVCTARDEIVHRMMRSSNQILVYNIGDPPSIARGLSRHDIKPDWCARLPFQVNAAIEFQVSLEAPGTFVGTSLSSFDRYLDAYRSLTQRKTELVSVNKQLSNAPNRTPHQSGGRCPEPVLRTKLAS